MMVSYSAITIWRELLHFLTVQTLQSSMNSNLLSPNEYISYSGGFPIAWYTHPIHSFSPQTAIDDGILLYKHYGKRAITFLYNSDTSITDQ
jgi:hypothetical protein